MNRLFAVMTTLAALALASCSPSYASSAPLADVAGETYCFFDGNACALAGRTRSVAIVIADDRTLWLDTEPLSGLFPGDDLAFVANKREEDDGIYQRDEEGVKAEIDDCCGGDSVQWRANIADELGYTDSPWQQLSLVGAYLRTSRIVSPEQWISVAPLIGTAGNGPDVILPGTPGLGGDVEDSYLSRIAVGHDADWGIGRLMGRGPLAVYLHAARFGGEAPDAYDRTMGLAGLGATTCDPRIEGAPCDWFEFSPTAFGGDYTVPGGHPDWTPAVIPYDGERDVARTVCRDNDSAPCLCATPRDGGWTLAPGKCGG